MLLDFITFQNEMLESHLARAGCSKFRQLNVELAEGRTHPTKDVKGRDAETTHELHEALLLVSGEIHNQPSRNLGARCSDGPSRNERRRPIAPAPQAFQGIPRLGGRAGPTPPRLQQP